MNAQRLSRLTGAQQASLNAALPGRVIAYADQDLPDGCDPPRSTLGVERNRSGGVTLHVRRGGTYHGTDSDVEAWIATGCADFSDLATLIGWLRSVSDPASAPKPAGHASTRAQHIEPAQLTDLCQVSVPSDEPPAMDPANLLPLMQAEVIGHRDAVAQIAEACATHASKPSPHRPRCILLCGPTGVGKSKLAITLPRALSEASGQPWGFHRFDMAEYSEAHSAARLYGAPPGYVGYDDGQSLEAKLASRQPSVLLFDEIEKAHPKTFTALLGLMDAGNLGARQGVAGNCIVVFTSNLAVDQLMAIDPRLDESSRDAEVRGVLRQAGILPELIGRLDVISVLSVLSAEDFAAIAAQTVRRTGLDYGVDVQRVEPAIITHVLRMSHGSGIGARGLEHACERLLGRVLSAAPRDVPVAVVGPADHPAIESLAPSG